MLAEALILLPRGRGSALAEVAVLLDLIVFLIVVVLLADRAHLSLFVLVVGRNADVGGNLHGLFGHPNRIGI